MFLSYTKAKERFAICKSCEHLTPVVNICKQCGCFMPAKTAIAPAQCPIGKWLKTEKEQDEKNYNVEE